MKATDLVFQRWGVWFFKEPGYQRFNGDKLIETVPGQEWQCENHAEALGRAAEYLAQFNRNPFMYGGDFADVF